MEDLNPEQARAVSHPKGPLLVVAGPGTGKTRTLTRRIAHLIREEGVDPASMTAITFTHRAALEMKERLETLLSRDETTRLFVGTFHALGLSVIENEAELLGFGARPVLYDEQDRNALLAEVLREITPRSGLVPVVQILAAMEDCIQRGVPVEGLDRGYDLADVAERYRAKKREENALDYDDLLVLPLTLFREHPDALDRLRARCRHLFVDEYQDVNGLQVEWIRCLGPDAESVMAIGDPDQAIYSFRGSDVKNFHAFSEICPGTEVIRLKSNYRSSATIVNASDQLIRGNRQRLEKHETAEAHGAQGLRIDLNAFPSEQAEAVFVSRSIERLAGGLGRYGLESDVDPEDDRDDYGFGDMAVLYRLNAQARAIEDTLNRAGIPFQRVGAGKETDLYERMVIASARLAVNPSCRASWRLLKCFREKAQREKRKREKSGEATKGGTDPGEIREPTVLHHAALTLARAFPEETGTLVAAADRLAGAAGDLGITLEAFLSGAPLVRREDPYEARAEKVTLSTLHGSKGLEFPVVFIVGLDEGIVPYLRGNENDASAALEEERRLLYVGMTRAQARLFLLRSGRRFLFGGKLPRAASSFLDEISSDLTRFVRDGAKTRRKPKDHGENQMSLF